MSGRDESQTWAPGWDVCRGQLEVSPPLTRLGPRRVQTGSLVAWMHRAQRRPARRLDAECQNQGHVAAVRICLSSCY